MLEQDTALPTPLALVRYFSPQLPAADGTLPSHWKMARALCSVAEDVLLLAQPTAGLLPTWELADAAVGTDELGRLLLHYLLAPHTTGQQIWPQVQAYLLQILPVIERLLTAGTPFRRQE